MVSFLFLLSSLAIALSVSNAEFYLYSTGLDPKRVVKLSYNDKICPSDYPSGFNIECKTGSKSTVSVFVNDEWVRTEFRQPFFVAGDIDGMPFRWKTYPSTAAISCRPNGRKRGAVSITVQIGCDEMEMSPSPDMEMLDDLQPLEEGNNDSQSILPITPEQTATPTVTVMMSASLLPSSQPSASAMPSPSGSPVAVPVPSSSASVSSSTFTLPSSSSSASASTSVFPTPSATASSTLSASKAISPISPPSGLSQAQLAEGCIVLDAVKDLQSPLTKGWVVEKDGLTFRKGDNKESITGKGLSPLYYNATAPRDSRFGVVVDMTTRKHAEHNDIWMSFTPGDFQAMRNEDKKTVTGWVKGYHNKFGRAAMVSTTDFNPHSFSTGTKLKAGETYTVGIGGRSSKVTVHRIVLFPCSGFACQKKDKSWKKSLSVCLPDLP